MLHKFSILHMGMHLKNYSVELLVFFVRGIKITLSSRNGM